MLDMDDLWTLDELAARVADALAVGYDGPANGRIRGVPDGRSIRWYTTVGIVDRPAAFRGRQAVYGERHLLQLVAIKRRQAAGRTLAEIQAELAGATDGQLRAIADVRAAEAAQAAPAVQAATAAPARPRFWASAPPAPSPPADSVTVLTAIRLAPGVTLQLRTAARRPRSRRVARGRRAAARSA